MLTKIIKDIKYDIDSIKKRDPAAKSSLEVLLLYPGVHAVMSHRLSHWLYKNNMFLFAPRNVVYRILECVSISFCR